MGMDNDDRPAKRSFEIGGDLSAISIDELEERISGLEDEIARIRAAISSKERSKDDAAAFFKS